MKFQRKIYLSRAQTRAMAMDHPIGDPTGGPAYGERRDPVSAVIAVATMATTYEAAFAGSVVYGMMFAGAAMNLVGNATGNKNLQMLGAVVGLAGGVGNLAGLGEAATTSSVAKGSLDAANSSGDAIANLNESQGWTSTSAPAADATAGAQAAQTTNTSAAIVGDANPNGVAAATAAPTAPVADTSQAGLIAGNSDKAALLSNSGYGEGMTGAQTSAFDAAAGSGATSNATGATQVMYDDGSSAMMRPDGSFVQGSVQAAPDSAFGYGGPAGTPYTMMDKLGNMLPDWSKMSTMDKLIATKIGSDVVGGVAHYIAPTEGEKAQTEAQKAQASLAQAQAAKIAQENALRDQRIANLNRNMQAGLGIGSNQGAVAINQPKPGLIQSQMRVA